MKFRRKLAAVLAGIITVTAFSGCSMLGNQTTNALGTYDFTQMDLVQLNKPSEGQDVAVIETNLGTITAVLYAEFAPKTVANFKKRAEEGFYDGKPFFALQKVFTQLPALQTMKVRRALPMTASSLRTNARSTFGRSRAHF